MVVKEYEFLAAVMEYVDDGGVNIYDGGDDGVIYGI